ncbi:MAG: hypothetical protein IJ355_06500 [Prevotella sp.]|nr:hypothetical protein [Prevotella sp.]
MSRICMVGAFVVMLQPACAQQQDDYEYERASICMMLIKHPAKKFGNEIQYVFSRMQMPSRFNNHDLGVRLVSFAEDREATKNIESFARQVALGRRLVAKWFDRDKTTGKMDMKLIQERGLYNSTKSDVNIARSQFRGKALLEDAGELLLRNTYFVMNDITYVDKSVGFGIFKDALNVTANLASIWAVNVDVAKSDNPFENPSLSSINAKLDDLKGFKVKIKSYLYRLKWNDDIANQFYSQYYIDSDSYDKKKKVGFENEKNLFELEYVGMVESSHANTTLSGTTTNEQLVRKVCTRAIDKNLADLQHQFVEFRIKAPLVSTEPIRAYVGMKEDISETSRFEVLERSITKDGKIEYKRVGVIRPVKGEIWDNRYWASEEKTKESVLGATTFSKVSGGEFYPGMLIREIR